MNMKRGLKLNVLIACESSATVRDAFRALGHNAWSCDLLPCDADPRYHVQDDALKLLRGEPVWCQGRVAMGQGKLKRFREKWDLMIGHPPCTYLCNSGVRWLFGTPPPSNRGLISYGDVGKGVFKGLPLTRWYDTVRWENMKKASLFFHKLWTADIPFVAIENPIPHRWGKLPPYTQIIQPWQFGHGETKATCLWLRNLPKLVPTDIVSGREQRVWKTPPGPLRWKIRSKTFEGIANAMATQWSAHIIAEKQKGKVV